MGCAPSQNLTLEPLSGSESEEECRNLVTKGSVAAAARLVSESRELILDLLPLRQRGSAALGEALASDSCIVETLSLRKCQLGSAFDMTKLSNFSVGLTRNATLRVLDLSGNMIDDYAAEHLALGIAKHSKLEIIILQSNALGSNGGGCGYRALARALANHCTVTELRIGGNRKEGLAAFCLSLMRARALRAVYFCDPGGHAASRIKCEVCANIGHAARRACEALAAARPDLMVCYSDVHGRIRFLNEPVVLWEPASHTATTTSIEQAMPI